MFARSLAVAGHYAYVADDDGSFTVYNIDVPSAPRLVGSVWAGSAFGVTLSGTYAYLGSDGVVVIDISNPASPQMVTRIHTSGDAAGIAVSGDLAYVASAHVGITILDIADPRNPHVITTGMVPGEAYNTIVSGGYVYLATAYAGFEILSTFCDGQSDIAGDGHPFSAPSVRAVPNPTSGESVIRFATAGAGPARVAIYDAVGRRVRVLADGVLSAGPHDLPWDGRDGAGRSVAAGTYLVRVSTSGRETTGRVVIVH